LLGAPAETRSATTTRTKSFFIFTLPHAARVRSKTLITGLDVNRLKAAARHPGLEPPAPPEAGGTGGSPGAAEGPEGDAGGGAVLPEGLPGISTGDARVALLQAPESLVGRLVQQGSEQAVRRAGAGDAQL
jgi:hypothetical protein